MAKTLDVFRSVVLAHPPTTSRALDLGLLGLRLWVGLTIPILYGLRKFPPPEGFVTMVGKMFPAPTFFAWCAVLSEVAGGFLIALGLATRPATLLLGFTMLVAASTKTGLAFGAADRMNSQHYLVACLVLLLTGPGRLSLDSLLTRRSRKSLADF